MKYNPIITYFALLVFFAFGCKSKPNWDDDFSNKYPQINGLRYHAEKWEIEGIELAERDSVLWEFDQDSIYIWNFTFGTGPADYGTRTYGFDHDFRWMKSGALIYPIENLNSDSIIFEGILEHQDGTREHCDIRFFRK